MRLLLFEADVRLVVCPIRVALVGLFISLSRNCTFKGEILEFLPFTAESHGSGPGL